MSCTVVSELPSGCRLRGTGIGGGGGTQSATTTVTTNTGNNSGNGSGGVGVGMGAGGITTIGTSSLHVGKSNALSGGTVGGTTTLVSGGNVGATNILQESNAAPLQRQAGSQKPCCFCWCCCCSCSWAKCLAIKNADENAPTRRDIGSSEFMDGEQPTLDEIRSWGKSFDKLMKSSNGRKVFRDFLRSEFSEENILFWLACEDLKKENSADVVEEKARLIYEDYISILSPREVSLDSRVREIVNRNMIEPTTHTFDEAQIQIYTLMHRDSYPRFLNSQKFKTLAELQDSSSTTGSKANSPT